MAIEEQAVRHVAKLSKLAFADDEIMHFTEQMSDIIDMVEQLKTVETTDVPITTHGYEIVNVYREDTPEKGTNRDLLMRNVKTEKDGFIQVPAMLGADEEGEA